jgi:hypothetical protein
MVIEIDEDKLWISQTQKTPNLNYPLIRIPDSADHLFLGMVGNGVGNKIFGYKKRTCKFF